MNPLSAPSLSHDSPERLPLARWVSLGVLLVVEWIVFVQRFSTESLSVAGSERLAATLYQVRLLLPFVVAVGTATVLFGGDRLRDELRRASGQTPHRPWPSLVGHAAAFVDYHELTGVVVEGGLHDTTVPGVWIAAWMVAGVATFLLLLAAAIPARALASLLPRTAPILTAGVLVGAVAWLAGRMTEEWWYPLSHSTLWAVRGLIGLVAADPMADPVELIVGTERFSVRIMAACSGYEGIGLMWVFLGVYLWLFRTSLRFPHALLLLPIGTALAWIANALRLTGLIALGTWLSPAIALGGFHSYSGSLLFSAVALSLVWVARRSRFFANPDALAEPADADDPTVAYLTPFLALVISTMVTGALSTGGFDALYPFRVLVTGTALWLMRSAYRELRWTWSWFALAAGAVAFVVWIALPAPPGDGDPGSVLAGGLAGLSAGAAGAWLLFRVIGAVITVPLAEELAFRGYLMRRLISSDFQSLPPGHFAWSSFLISSLLFGAMHQQLLAGTLVGMTYALVVRRRGELADAVVAHAVTNALLAAYVLATGTWSFWA